MQVRSTLALVAVAVLPSVALAQSQTAPADTSNASKVIVAHAAALKWMPGPAALPPGAQVVVLEGNPADSAPITLRLKFPANYRVPPHFHSGIEHVTVLSGTLNVGMGEQASYTKGTALRPGSFGVIPAKMVHYAWTGPGGATIQLHSIGPWMITYVNAADDPRNKHAAGSQ